MPRGLRFFSKPKPPRFEIGRMPPWATYETIKAQLLNDYQKLGPIDFLKRLKLEKSILEKYIKLDEKYRILGQSIAVDILGRTQSGQPITSKRWQTHREQLEAILPKSFQEQKDWLEARQILAQKLFPLAPPVYQSSDISDVRLA